MYLDCDCSSVKYYKSVFETLQHIFALNLLTNKL